MSSTRLWTLGGLAAPLVYATAVFLGGLLTPGYSHIAGPISALYMEGAPAATLLVPLFALYNALLISFAFTMRDALRLHGAHVALIVPIALAVTALAGAAMLLYPMDPIGLTPTESGRLHVFFAGVAAVATMIAVFFAATSLRRTGTWPRFTAYSFLTFALILAFGAWAGIAATAESPFMGLAERLVIGAFLQWVFVTALVLLRRVD